MLPRMWCFLKASTVFYVSRRCFRPAPDRNKKQFTSWLGFVAVFSPWFGFYSHHLSVTSLKASLVSKGRDERRMTWLCSLPKHTFWDTNQGLSVRERTTRRGMESIDIESLSRLPSFLPFSSLHLSPPWCESSPLCVWLPQSVWHCVCLCVGWVGLMLLSVWCCSLLRCVLPIMNLLNNLSRSPSLLRVSLENRYW